MFFSYSNIFLNTFRASLKVLLIQKLIENFNGEKLHLKTKILTKSTLKPKTTSDYLSKYKLIY